jgi:hypothetical protein
MRLGRDFHPLAAEYAGQKNSAPTLGTSLQIALSLPLRNSLKRGTRLYCVAHSICRSSDHRVPGILPVERVLSRPKASRQIGWAAVLRMKVNRYRPRNYFPSRLLFGPQQREALVTAPHRNAVGSRTNSMRRTSLPPASRRVR